MTRSVATCQAGRTLNEIGETVAAIRRPRPLETAVGVRAQSGRQSASGKTTPKRSCNRCMSARSFSNGA